MFGTLRFLVVGFIRHQKYMKRVDCQRSDPKCCKDRWSWLNRVGWSIIVVWDKGLLVRNRVMGGHPVANQGVARMDKQNKQVMAGLMQLKFIQMATTVEALKQL